MKHGGLPSNCEDQKKPFCFMNLRLGSEIYQRYAKKGIEKVKIYHQAKNGIEKVRIYLNTVMVLLTGIIKLLLSNKLVLKQLNYITRIWGVLT